MNEILRRFYRIAKQKFFYYKVIFNKKKRFLEIEIFGFVMGRIKLYADLNKKKIKLKYQNVHSFYLRNN